MLACTNYLKLELLFFQIFFTVKPILRNWNVLVTFNLSFLGILGYIVLFLIQSLAAIRNQDI